MGHQIIEKWMNQEVTTLADLWPAHLKAVIVGINPAPVSVTAGHYYQGNLGKGLFRRLKQAKILHISEHRFDDDSAVAQGLAFTDIVKRPSSSAGSVTPDEFRHGRQILQNKLEDHSVPLVIFAFKKPATVLFGNFSGNGFLSGTMLGNAQVFVMPGPYESAATANPTLDSLREFWQSSSLDQ